MCKPTPGSRKRLDSVGRPAQGRFVAVHHQGILRWLRTRAAEMRIAHNYNMAWNVPSKPTGLTAGELLNVLVVRANTAPHVSKGHYSIM